MDIQQAASSSNIAPPEYTPEPHASETSAERNYSHVPSELSPDTPASQRKVFCHSLRIPISISMNAPICGYICDEFRGEATTKRSVDNIQRQFFRWADDLPYEDTKDLTSRRVEWILTSNPPLRHSTQGVNVTLVAVKDFGYSNLNGFPTTCWISREDSFHTISTVRVDSLKEKLKLANVIGMECKTCGRAYEVCFYD